MIVPRATPSREMEHRATPAAPTALMTRGCASDRPVWWLERIASLRKKAVKESTSPNTSAMTPITAALGPRGSRWSRCCLPSPAAERAPETADGRRNRREAAGPAVSSRPVGAAPFDQADHVVAPGEGVISVAVETHCAGHHRTQPDLAVSEPGEEWPAGVAVVQARLGLDDLTGVVLIVVFHALVDLHGGPLTAADVSRIADVVPHPPAAPVIVEGAGAQVADPRAEWFVEPAEHEVVADDVVGVALIVVVQQIADVA